MEFLFYDVEIYPNFFLFVFKDIKGRKVEFHSEMEFRPILKRLKEKIDNFVLIGFNNSRYDTVMLNYILQKYEQTTSGELARVMFEMSKEIIEEKAYYKKVMAEHGIGEHTLEMDLSNYVGYGLSLKELGCRLHHPKLETLPIPPHQHIEKKDIPVLSEYCSNDVDITMLVFEENVGEVEAIWEIIDYFDLPKTECGSTLGALVETALVDPSMKPNPPSKFRYVPPVNFNFKTQQMKDIEETYRGLILTAESKFSMEIEIGQMKVTMALGGIHGAVPSSSYINLIDLDAKQYYPETIDKYDLLAPTVKDRTVLRKLITAKEHFGEIGEVKKEKAIKKAINSYYGRTGFSNSKLYSPDKMFSMTITGQLMLLRLVEDLTQSGYEVVYLNTDGLTILDNGTTDYKEIVSNWEKEFGYTIKEVRFKRAIYRDVNNFIAEDENGEVKRKGDLNTETTHKRSCFARVSVNAVVEHLLHGVDIRDYINASEDIRDFLMYHKYNADMQVYLEEYGKYKRLPNVVRYYLSNNKENKIVHKKEDEETYKNRDKNENVVLVPVIRDTKLPKDLDIERYVTIAFDVLSKVTGKEVEDNPYITSLLEQLESLGV